MNKLTLLTTYGHALAATAKLYVPNLRVTEVDTKRRQDDLRHIEESTEQAVLDGFTIVIPCQGFPKDAVIRAGVVPLRWGGPRILIASEAQFLRMQAGEEIERTWCLWRYAFDPQVDLVIRSGYRTALAALADHEIKHGGPFARPTYACHEFRNGLVTA